MNKTFKQIGTSWGIIIPKAIFELLDINPVKDEYMYEVENKSLIIKKAKKES